MNHFAKIAEKLSAYELDGMLLTCEANRFYASGFHSTGTDGVALVTREGNFYFTDSRYIEAAHNKVQDAEIAMTDAAHPYVDLINAAMEKTHVQKLGFEDAYMTVADYRHYSEKLHCQLVPATELLISLRQSKDEEEIQRMIAAQRIAEGALEETVAYVKERKQFGRSISAFQNTQFELAEMKARVEAAKYLVYAAALKKQEAMDGKKVRYSVEAAQAKLIAARTASDVTRRCLQLFGGYGYTRDYPIERMMRDAKITEIYEGTSEVQMMVISGALLK